MKRSGLVTTNPVRQPHAQILIILNTTHKSVGGKEVPSPYLDFLALTGFTTLDVVSLVPFDCM